MCVLSVPLLPVYHWLIWDALSESRGFVLESFPCVCSSVGLLPRLLSLSLSGSSLHEEQTSRWFPAGIHFLRHSYFYCTVITLNHSPRSLKKYSALRPRVCPQKLPVQTNHISCEEMSVYSGWFAWIKQIDWWASKLFCLHIFSLIYCICIISLLKSILTRQVESLLFSLRFSLACFMLVVKHFIQKCLYLYVFSNLKKININIADKCTYCHTVWEPATLNTLILLIVSPGTKQWRAVLLEHRGTHVIVALVMLIFRDSHKFVLA